MENKEEVVIVKKKRGRKPKSETQNNITIAINETEHVPKKRGRKPKGGKLILKPTNDMIETSNVANIILHLKCSMRDIKSNDENMINTTEYNPKVPPSILSYEENNNYQQYDDKESINNLAYVNNQQNNVKSPSQNVCSKCLSHMEITDQQNKEEINIKYKEIIKSINEIGFENSAATYSFSESAKIGGDIGWINENSLNNNIKKNINSLKVGEFTKPIILSNGILILKLINTKNLETTIDIENELKKAINYERNRQLNQYSKIYYNKIKKNLDFNG